MTRSGLSRSTASSDTLQGLIADAESAADDTSQTPASTLSDDTIGRRKAPGRRVSRVSGLKEARATSTEADAQGRTVSGETLVDGADASQSSLLQQGLTALNLPWNLSSFFKSTDEEAELVKEQSIENSSASAGDADTPRAVMMKERSERVKAKKERDEKDLAERKHADDAKATRRSSRLSMVGKASQAVDAATSVLGKRSRDALDKGKEKLGGLRRRASLRPRDRERPDPPSFEGPVAKRLRLEDAKPKVETPEPVTRHVIKPRVKRWLNHGLYVGQNRNFNPRLTDAKNREILAGKPQVKERRMLPLPMFAGQRLIERGREFKLPFDVFSPLPSGQPKPDEWKKTNKNVFVGDAGSIWKNTKLQEYSTCVCSAETGCDDDCQNRYMFYECDQSNCRLEPEVCGNRSFEGLRKRTKAGGKYNVGVEVIKTADRGYGVRSNRTFEPNQIIVEYTGEIITQDECEDRMRNLYKDNECYYLMLFDQNMIIDATRGSIARFVNHSCEPNCRMEKWTVAGKPRMALFAGDKGIMSGEELTYDYNFDPFSQKNVQECRCGSSKCRGVLGPKPKEPTKPKDPKDAKSNVGGGGGLKAAAKRKVQEVLDESTNQLNKRRRVITAVSVKGKKMQSAKARATRKMVKARVYSSSAGTKEKLIKKASSRSVKSAARIPPVRRSSTATRIANALKKKSSTSVTALKSKRTASSSTESLVSSKSTTSSSKSKSKSKLKSKSKAVEATTARPPSRRQSVRLAAGTLTKNVVRTVRGAAGGRERTIRPVAAVE